MSHHGSDDSCEALYKFPDGQMGYCSLTGSHNGHPARPNHWSRYLDREWTPEQNDEQVRERLAFKAAKTEAAQYALYLKMKAKYDP